MLRSGSKAPTALGWNGCYAIVLGQLLPRSGSSNSATMRWCIASQTAARWAHRGRTESRPRASTATAITACQYLHPRNGSYRTMTSDWSMTGSCRLLPTTLPERRRSALGKPDGRD